MTLAPSASLADAVRPPLTGTAGDAPGATGCSRMHRDASSRNDDAGHATESAASSLHQIQADREVPGHRSRRGGLAGRGHRRVARCAAGSARSRELPNDASDAILPIFASVMKILRKSCGVKWSGRPSASVRPVLARAAVRRLRMVLLQILRFWAAHRRWKRTTRSPGPAAPPPPRPKPHTSTTPPGSLTAASAACSSTWPPAPRHHRDRQPPDRQDHHADPGPAAGLHPPRRHHPDHPEVGTSQITRPRDFPARPEVHPPGPT